MLERLLTASGVSFIFIANQFQFRTSSNFQFYHSKLNQSHYDVLNVPPNCSSKEVRDAYIKLTKKNHPDRNLDDPTMHKRFIRIKEAYSVLSNAATRRDYDIALGRKEEFQVKRSRAAYTYYKNQEPYNWEHQRDASRFEPQRIPNTLLVTILIFFSLIGGGLQLFFITYHAKKQRERSLEANWRNVQIESAAREKALLYGNRYQIELLKRKMGNAYLPDSPNGTEISSNEHPDSMKKKNE